MSLNFQNARQLLRKGQLTKLFIDELGWDHCSQKLNIHVADQDYPLAAIAEQRGCIAWLCESPDGTPPDHTARLKLDRKLSETSFEHLIVFVNHDRTCQSWVWVRREPGKPPAPRTHEYRQGQSGDALLQKLQTLYISLEEEEAGDVSTLVVAERARAAFDVERVTKNFYREFDTHRKALIKFIEGISVLADREWYASVMLNRLMFVYFIQRKGFLDGDSAYLRHRLLACQDKQGKDQFYSFYRYFLLRLFHEGFGKRATERAPDLEKLIGNIPYLNGGLFDVHELEKPERYGDAIQIPDKAFEEIFDYFDRYQWHLDERPLRKDNEINPDVLGYIFEKFINQKQMGAYYTKEDITEYIGKNTIVPFLFDAARAKCKVAFEPGDSNSSPVWDLLKENPDRYIYDAVHHGTELELPPEIAIGVSTTEPDLLERRKAWNKPAPAEYALPTEIWREVVARRQRYADIKTKIADGDVAGINDFITLNLDVRKFANDVIQSIEGPDLLLAFWNALSSITVLDPTCGSGAFLFAALNILDPIYEACLDRMEAFLAEWGDAGSKKHPNYFKKFSNVLASVEAHPNRRYFVLKSIVINNLYGVDIMEEAVEICKLRLFLKLAAQVEPDTTRDNLGIEPLPDIDFNIRAGNTLVGYATYKEVENAVEGGKQGTFDFDNAMVRISAKAADLQQAFDKFRQLQTEGNGSVPAADKLELQSRLKTLEEELNDHLATSYGVNIKSNTAYSKWLKSHQPFHWFIQFYGIMHGNGGFDVIIGNPPWKEYSAIRKTYSLRNYTTESSGNLYALCSERAIQILSPKGLLSFIVQLPIVCSSRMATIRSALSNNTSFLATITCDDRPGKLFDGLQHCRSTIFILKRQLNAEKTQFFSSGYRRWATESRSNLFNTMRFVEISFADVMQQQFPKVGNSLQSSILRKLFARQHVPLETLISKQPTSDFVFYQESAQYWVKATIGLPYYDKNGIVGAPAHGRFLFFDDKRKNHLTCSLFNSSLFYCFSITYGDCFHISDNLVASFPVLPLAVHDDIIQSFGTKLMADLTANAERKTITTKSNDRISYDEFRVGDSKPIIDEIDTVLAKHYGFTDEELDFIINYDIKYRMGRDAESEEE